MATGDTYVDLGMAFKVATGKPATEDQTGYDALTWTTVGGVISIGERGDSVEDISEGTLSDSRVEHFNGLKDGGTVQLVIKFIEGDAGQAALVSAAGSNSTYSFEELDIDAEAHFSYGRVMSVRRREATTTSYKAYIVMLGINSARFTGVEDS